MPRHYRTAQAARRARDAEGVQEPCRIPDLPELPDFRDTGSRPAAAPRPARPREGDGSGGPEGQRVSAGIGGRLAEALRLRLQAWPVGQCVLPALAILAFASILLFPECGVTLRTLPAVHLTAAGSEAGFAGAGPVARGEVVLEAAVDPSRPAATHDPLEDGAELLQARYASAVRQLEAGHVDAGLSELRRLAASESLPPALRLPVLLAAMRGQRLRLATDGAVAAQALENASRAVLEEDLPAEAAWEALDNLATVCALDGRYDEGLDLLTRGLLAYPEQPGADGIFLAYGRRAMDSGNPDTARTVLSVLVENFPDSPLLDDAWAAMARARERLGNPSAALEALEHLAADGQYPLRDPDILLTRARCLAAVTGIAGDGGATGSVGRSRAHGDGADGVERLYRRFLGLELQGPDAERVLLGFGDLLERIGHGAGARDAWKRLDAGGVTPAAFEARLRLVEDSACQDESLRAEMACVLARADAEELEALYRGAMGAWPGTDLGARCQLKLALLLASTGRGTEAMETALDLLHADSAHVLAPQAADIVRERFTALAGKAREAAEYSALARAWEADPLLARAVGEPDTVTACALGRGWLLEGDTPRAVAALRPLLARGMTGEGLYALGVCYQQAYAARDWEAILALGRAVASWALPETAAARLVYACAVAEEALGDSAEAQRLWQRVLEHPASLPAHRGYAAVLLAGASEKAGLCARALDLWNTAVAWLSVAPDGPGDVQSGYLAHARERLAALAGGAACGAGQALAPAEASPSLADSSAR